MKNMFRNMMEFVQRTNVLLKDGLTLDDLPEEYQQRFQAFFKPLEELDEKVKAFGEQIESIGETVTHFGERLTTLENQLKTLSKPAKTNKKEDK